MDRRTNSQRNSQRGATNSGRGSLSSYSGDLGSFGSFHSSSSGGVSSSRYGKLRRETNLPLLFVMERLRHGIDSAELYTDLFVFLPFLVLFIMFFLAGRDVESNFYVLQGMRDRLFTSEYPSQEAQVALYRQQVLRGERLWVERDKDYRGISNAADYMLWLKTVLIPSAFDCQNPNVSYTFNAPIGQNYEVGALRLRTQRVGSRSCNVREQLYPSNESGLSRVCYGESDDGNEITEPLWCNVSNPVTAEPMFQYRPCDGLGVPISAVEGFYHCGGYTVEIPFNYTCNQALAIADAMDTPQCKFVNQWDTRFVSAEYFLYTPATDQFHSVKLYSEVVVSGFWFNQWLFRSFVVWSTTMILQTVLDIVFLLYVLYYWFALFRGLYIHVKRDGRNAVAYIFAIWNMLEFVNLVILMVVFGFRFAWYSVSSSATALKLPMDPTYPPKLDDLQALYESQVYGNGINTMFVFLKILKYVRLNPRLNVLTRTISACQQSIVGVLVLFFTIILGYAVTGWNLFGVNVARFRNLGVAISALVRMLVGDIDYPELRNENRFLAGAFFWSYMILALFLLLNFLIAIISESFAQVSGKAYSTPVEELLIRTLQHIKQILAPSNVHRIVTNACRGKSEAVLLRKVLNEMEEHYLIRREAKIERKRKRTEAQLKVLVQGGRAEEWQSLLVQDEDDPNDEELEVRVKYDDLPVLMKADVFADLGAYYWGYTWDMLLNEYDDERKSSEEVDKRRMAETVQIGVEKVLGDDIDKITALDKALKNVEKEVARILHSLE